MTLNIYPLNKQCKNCLELKTLQEFSPLKLGRFGRHAFCKQCRRQRNIDRYHEKKDIAILKQSIISK